MGKDRPVKMAKLCEREREKEGRGLTRYTHLVRDAHHCVSAEYPWTAGLCDWPWMVRPWCEMDSRGLFTIKQLYWLAGPSVI